MGPGDVVACRFVIEAVGGSGGMGVVYRARDRTNDALVALKVLHDASAYSARFEREIELLAGLDHPAIVRYVAHGLADNGQPYLVMEWLEGVDLAARLARGAFTSAEAMTLGARLADGLAHAHERGVIHRDLKPGNVILVGGDIARATLVDFGIARLPGQTVTDTGGVLGTLGYMAPEQARGDPDVDARADVFALGAILYAALTGAPPFDGPNPVAVVLRLIDERPMHPGEVTAVPAALDDLVTRMLARASEARPADGRAVAEELARVAAADAGRAPAVYAPPVKAPAPPPPRSRRLRVALPLGLAVALVAAAAIGLALFASPRPPRAHRATAPLAATAHAMPCDGDVCVPLGLASPASVDVKDVVLRAIAIARTEEPTAQITTAQFKNTKGGAVDTTQPPPAVILFYFVYTPLHAEKKSSLQLHVALGTATMWRTPIPYDHPPPAIATPRCSGHDAWLEATKSAHLQPVMTTSLYGIRPGHSEWGFNLGTGSLVRVDAIDCHVVK